MCWFWGLIVSRLFSSTISCRLVLIKSLNESSCCRTSPFSSKYALITVLWWGGGGGVRGVGPSRAATLLAPSGGGDRAAAPPPPPPPPSPPARAPGVILVHLLPQRLLIGLERLVVPRVHLLCCAPPRPPLRDEAVLVVVVLRSLQRERARVMGPPTQISAARCAWAARAAAGVAGARGWCVGRAQDTAASCGGVGLMGVLRPSAPLVPPHRPTDASWRRGGAAAVQGGGVAPSCSEGKPPDRGCSAAAGPDEL